MDPKIRGCLLKRFATNGFNISEIGGGMVKLMVRGSEDEDTYVILAETDDGFNIVTLSGKFKGKNKKELMQRNLNIWVSQCRAEAS